MRACLLPALLLLPQDPSPEAEPSKAKFKVAHGLSVELFSAEPHFVNPVAFDIDALGRAYVVETHRVHTATFDVRGKAAWVDDDLACRTVADREAMHRKHMGDAAYEKLRVSERVRRVEDVDGDGRADRAVTFAEGFDSPADGLASGVLVRGKDVWLANIPNLWHLRDEDGDGRADARKVLHHGYGVRLAFIGHDLHGLTFGPDGKLYFSIGDRGLHVEHEGRTVSNPDSGAVLRCNPDGSQLELFCTGLRNPQELAFDDHGNLWTVDNNCDNGDRARLTLLLEDGDAGWRIGYQQAPRAGPWVAEGLWKPSAAQTAPSQIPPVANIGHGPSGLAFHPGVAALPAALDGHFFLSNFPGNILAWRVTEKGAGFEVHGLHEVLSNIWSTDVSFAPDGSLWVLDWVDGWGMPNKGRIWRLRDPDTAGPAVEELKALLADDLSARGDDVLAERLGHRDRRVRQAAQFELAARGAEAAFLKAAEKGRPLLGRLHALWGLGQAGRAAAVAPFLRDAEAEVRAQAAKVAGDGRVLADGLVPLLRDPSLRVRARAATALGKSGRKEAVGPLFDMLRENADQDAHLRHAGVAALARLGAADAAISKVKDPSAAVRTAALLVLRRLGRPEVVRFLDDAEPALVLEAARAIHDAPVNEAMPALADRLADPALNERVLLRAVNAAFRTGRAKDLATFAASSAPRNLRVEALRALADWASPSGRDRVLHLWRPLPPRDASAARAALVEAFPALNADVRAEALKAAAALDANDLLPRAVALFADRAGAAAEVRIEALRALSRWKAEGLPKAVADGLDDPEPLVRREAILLAGRSGLSDVAARLEALVKNAGGTDLRQAAVLALADVDGGETVLRRFLADAAFPPELRLELLEAAAKRKVPAPAPAWTDCLEGGDAEVGQKLFFDRGDLQCLRCHQVGDRGGTVGPALTGHGTAKSRDYLLEALVEPNKTISQGFGQTAFRLENGDVVVGRIERETDAEIVLILPDGPTRTLPKSSISARKEALSAMPEDLVKRLTKREVRDLVEFLSTLR